MTPTQPTTTVNMPSLGESVDEGTITRWLKEPGDPIEAGEALLEVATDKVDTEVPSPVSGVLLEILAREDDVVAIGADLAVISTEDDQSKDAGEQPPSPAVHAQDPSADPEPAPLPPAVSTPTAASRPAAKPPEPSAVAEPPPPPRPPASAASPAPVREQAPSDSGATVEKLPRIRRTIAARMVESLQTSAQLTTVLEVDVTAIARLRQSHKTEFFTRTGVKLSFLPFFAKAAVEALAEHRVLNASVNSDVTEVTYHAGCHLGIAVDSDKGLMVPVIRNAHELSIEGLARAIADKADRVRNGTITANDLAGGTFTLTNTGSRGALFDTPIINQPQTGILGTGAVVDRLVPIGGSEDLRIGVRSMAYLSISYDHRIVDGADAARYLSTMKQRLEAGFHATDLR